MTRGRKFLAGFLSRSSLTITQIVKNHVLVHLIYFVRIPIWRSFCRKRKPEVKHYGGIIGEWITTKASFATARFGSRWYRKLKRQRESERMKFWDTDEFRFCREEDTAIHVSRELAIARQRRKWFWEICWVERLIWLKPLKIFDFIIFLELEDEL